MTRIFEFIRAYIAWWGPRQKQALLDWALSSLIGARFISRSNRASLLRLAGVRVSGSSSIESGIVLRAGRQLTVGSETYINTQCLFDLEAPVTIGKNVHVGPRVMMVTASHEEGTAASRGGPVTGSAFDVGDGCWIGAGAIVLGGVRVGAGCVIAAGSVVTKDCSPHGLYAGTPAVRKKDLPVPGPRVQ